MHAAGRFACASPQRVSYSFALFLIPFSNFIFFSQRYELLRLEFEQNLAAHEQTGPINKEMRHLISSLQNHIGQLKGENVRVKRKLKEANLELARLRQIIEDAGLRVVGGGILLPSPLHLGGVSEVSEGSLVGTPQFTSDSSNDGTGNLVIQSESSCDENATRKVRCICFCGLLKPNINFLG